MKKLSIFFSLFIIGMLLNAQIIITSTSLPQPGDTFALKYMNNPVINIGTPLPTSQTWDFTMLENDSMKYATYGITANLPFASEYPQSNLYTWGPSVMYGGPGTPLPGVGWGWMLFRSDVNGMDVIGYRQGNPPDVLSSIQTPPLKLMKTPCGYDTTFSQNSQWEISFNANPSNVDTTYISYVSKNIVCDAWGTLSTPIEQNIEVIRIHEYQISVDSVFGKMNGITVYKMELKRDTANNYLFYTPTKRHPIVTVWCRPNGDIYAAEYLFYSRLYNSIDESNLNDIKKIFPNPAKNNFTIETFGSSVLNLEAYSLDGKQIYNGKIPQNGIINCESWNEGIYFLIIRDNNNVRTEKIIISR